MVSGGDLHDSPGGARRGWRGHKATAPRPIYVRETDKRARMATLALSREPLCQISHADSIEYEGWQREDC